jgi:diguanylate cyclase (GGDEF)-like protein/PAS domain S-box-containing protein
MNALRFIVSLALALLAGEATAIATQLVFPADSDTFFIVHAAAFSAVAFPLSYFFALRPLMKRLAELTAKHDDHLTVLDELRLRVAERDIEVATAQHTLEETNNQLDAALNNMRQGLCMYDADTRLVLCNDAYLKMYGLSPEAAQRGSTYRQVLQELAKADNFHQDPDQFIERIKAAITNGETLEVFARLKHGIIRIVAQPMANGGWVATHEDVTAQRNAEAELARTRHFLDTVIEHVPATILVKDAKDFRYVLLNQAGVEFFGLPKSTILGHSADEFFPKEAADAILARDLDLLAKGSQDYYGDNAMHVAAHGLRQVSTKRLVIRNDEGEPAYLLGIIEDITDRKLAEAQIVHLAHHDTLTGLPNRAAFNQHMEAAIAHAETIGGTFAVISIDLDRFKEINDIYGHAAGDAVLVEVSERLRIAAGGAFLSRLGGDEFIVIASEGEQPATAETIAENLQTTVAREFEIDGHSLAIGLSVGIAIYPTDGAEKARLLSNADAALYRAKAEGRDTVRFFEQEMDAALRDRRVLQQDLRSAIPNGELKLFYQPLQHADGEVSGFEALARWDHPTRGPVPPSTFIPLAEESSLVISMGEWILREACREAASWPRPLNVAVNLSPVQFRHGDVAAMIHAVLLETGLAANRLEIEITESVLIGDFSRAVSILRRMKALGVRISMDDFGTGYSSLSYLQSFPFDKIKIDRAFIANVERNSQSASIVRAVIGLGRGLQVPVVAEGVETREQMAFLQEESCDQMQGYLLGRPGPIGNYAEILGRPVEAADDTDNAEDTAISA